jgi:hypothetical protein
MNKKLLFTQFLALTGTLFLWVTVLSPVFFSIVRFIQRGFLGQIDYLMPAELFPLAFLGGVLLLVASFLAHSHRKLIGWSLGIAVFMLVAGQILAVVTGLASGAIQPSGWQWLLVIASLAIYVLCLIAMGIGGVLLSRDLFKSKGLSETTSKP